MKTRIENRSGALHLTGPAIDGTVTTVDVHVDPTITDPHKASGSWKNQNADIGVHADTFARLSTRNLPYCLILVTSGKNVTGCTSSDSCSAGAARPASSPP